MLIFDHVKNSGHYNLRTDLQNKPSQKQNLIHPVNCNVMLYVSNNYFSFRSKVNDHFYSFPEKIYAKLPKNISLQYDQNSELYSLANLGSLAVEPYHPAAELRISV